MITIQKNKRKILIVFDDVIADIMTNKIFQAIIKELFIKVNPDEKDFNIFKIINEIHRHIQESIKKLTKKSLTDEL